MILQTPEDWSAEQVQEFKTQFEFKFQHGVPSPIVILKELPMSDNEVTPPPPILVPEMLVPPSEEAVQVTDIRDPWLCKGCGSVLGSVYKEKVRHGLSISRLMIFRGAVKVGENLPVNFIFAKIDSGEVICSRCGEMRPWTPTPETLRYLSEGHHHHVARKNRNIA